MSEIKAGTYQLVATRFDKPTSQPGQPFTFERYERGDLVQLDAEEAHRLVTAGAVVEKGALEKADAAAKVAAAQAALALLPADARQELTAAVLEDAGADDRVAELEAEIAALQARLAQQPPSSPPSPVKPAKTAPKPAWIAWAKAQGADPAWADNPDTTQQQLIERYGA